MSSTNEAIPDLPGVSTIQDNPSPANSQTFPMPSLEPLSTISPIDTQPTGSLTGRILFINGGHGSTYIGPSWDFGRGISNNMVEDLGNQDQMTLFAYQAFNAGATIIPMRPIGNQTNEIIIDNTSPAAEFYGTWSNSTTGYYWGQDSDSIRYRFTAASTTETAFARYTPTITNPGFYPVYTWAKSGTNHATDQLYRIKHSGGIREVHINHRYVGQGWIYLGTYYFNTGAEANVEISNLSATTGSIVIADGIRFGNGMGNVIRNGTTSGRPREDEGSRYWIYSSMSNSTTLIPAIYDYSTVDSNDNVGAPTLMSAHMNDATQGQMTDRMFLSFHSNAKGNISPFDRGADGLWNNETVLSSSYAGTKTPNQERLAHLLGEAVNVDINALQAFTEYAWTSRPRHELYRTDYAFGEIRWDYFHHEMDGTILEVAYHDNAQDAALMLDPKVRSWIARSTVKGAIRYFNEFGEGSLSFPPDAPTQISVQHLGTGLAEVSWMPASTHPNAGGEPTGYAIYQSSNGYGFTRVLDVESAETTTVQLTVPLNELTYFRVAARNAGGESMPGEVAGLLPVNTAAPILIVNGFDRLDRGLNPTETRSSGNYQRVKPWKSNSFDYIVQHAKALQAAGRGFDSTSNELVTSGLLANYKCVVWISGNESLADKTITTAEQSLLHDYLQAGNSLFISGSDIALDLDFANNGRSFLRDTLGVSYQLNASGTNQVAAVSGQIMAGIISPTTFGTAAGIYNTVFPPAGFSPYKVDSADVLTPVNSATDKTILTYQGGASSGQAAAIARDNGNYRTIMLGFPFESCTNETAQSEIMAQAMNFLIPDTSSVAKWPLY